MHNLDLSDKDIMLIDYALRLFSTAVTCVARQWRPQDLADLHSLCDDFARLAEADRREREARLAESAARSL